MIKIEESNLTRSGLHGTLLNIVKSICNGNSSFIRVNGGVMSGSK